MSVNIPIGSERAAICRKLYEQARLCKSTRGAAILLGIKGLIEGRVVISDCTEMCQVADLYFDDDSLASGNTPDIEKT